MPLPSSSPPSVQLMDAISRKDVQSVLLTLAHMHTSTGMTAATSPPGTALHAAASAGLLSVCQLLLWVSTPALTPSPKGLTFLDSTTRTRQLWTARDELHQSSRRRRTLSTCCSGTCKLNHTPGRRVHFQTVVLF